MLISSELILGEHQSSIIVFICTIIFAFNNLITLILCNNAQYYDKL